MFYEEVEGPSLLRIGASPHRSDKLGHFQQSMSCGAWIEHIIPSEVSFGPFAEHAGLVLDSVESNWRTKKRHKTKTRKSVWGVWGGNGDTAGSLYGATQVLFV